MFKKFESITEKKKKFFGKPSLNTIGETPGTYTPPTFVGLFISEWRITNFGQTITLPYNINGFYTGSINWGDGKSTPNDYVNRIHVYSSPGDYRITISGDVTGFEFNNTGDKNRILKIINWGKLRGYNNSNQNMFYGCSNLKIDTVYDVIDLKGISSTSSMFRNCISLTTINNLEDWDLSNVSNTSYMFFSDSLFVGDISNWNVSNVTNMDFMLDSATLFNGNLSNWNVSALTSAVGMLNNCGMSVLNYSNMLIGWSEIPNLQNNVTLGANQIYYSDYSIYARNYLTGATKGWTITNDLRAPFISVWKTTTINELVELPFINTGTYTGRIYWGDGTMSNNMYSQRFHQYSNPGIYTITISGDVKGFRFSNTGNKNKILEIKQWGPLVGTSNSNFAMFYGCSNLVINQVSDILHVSGITSLSSSFRGCTSIGIIKNLESWNLEKVIDMSSLFRDCTNFDQSLGDWNVSAVTNMQQTLTNTKLSVTNYSNTLIGWSSLPTLQTNTFLGANNLKYNTAGSVARNILSSSPYFWNISDSGIV